MEDVLPSRDERPYPSSHANPTTSNSSTAKNSPAASASLVPGWLVQTVLSPLPLDSFAERNVLTCCCCAYVRRGGRRGRRTRGGAGVVVGSEGLAGMRRAWKLVLGPSRLLPRRGWIGRCCCGTALLARRRGRLGSTGFTHVR